VLPALQPLVALSCEELGELVTRARDVGFTPTLIGELEGLLRGRFDRVRLPLVRWHLGERRDAAATMARLFAYDDQVKAEEAREALGPLLAERLEHAGLLQGDARGLRAQLRMMPFEGLYLFADHPGHGETVMGPGPTTAELACACSYAGVPSVLDVGCGAGSLALLAAHAGCPRVLGVDISERAVQMARLNARLNGLDAEFRAGDLLAPVSEEAFALVVSQPAFVIQPDDVETTTYLHGGSIGDELAMRLIAELPPQVAPGGEAILRVDTPAWSDRKLQDRVREALGDPGAQFHLLIIAAAGHAPDYQAVAYAAEADPTLSVDYASLVHRYRAHIQKVGIERHLSSLIILRRLRDGETPWTVTLTPPGLSRASAANIRAFRDAFRLARQGAEELMSMSVRVSPHARLVEQRDPSAGSRATPRVQFVGGLSQDQEISDAVGVLLEVFGPGCRVDAAIEAFAARCGAETGEVCDQVVSFVRDSLLRGLLEPTP